MGLSQEEIDARLKKVQDAFDDALDASDAEKLTDLYHPHAVMVQVGKRAVYGHDKILEIFEEMVKNPCAFTTLVDANFEAGNGEYLIQRGRLDFKLPDGTETFFPYEKICRRMPDGTYLIYHDEVET